METLTRSLELSPENRLTSRARRPMGMSLGSAFP
ncbi:hypothetical protein PDIG_15440 [Penicillium digitatum PHI26]|uniref:Uncharacterized protein n=2 Tax=Penicillium digitatum TaxID=36651 RepID=K9G680_PEND2|nr:hypothetical protein PDIP_30980 [Penicillium digitatum Pd1]EKV17420.1 hypothetical protein PDIG_15440 [Penicillium digitatum PHI26]EKV17583.1 hypothetical protein PDIP_30980 [Penicillium digitatum Pd1]